MTGGSGSSETIHAGCVAIGGRGVLISGPSGSGKSDLALRLIDRGAVLVSDDYTVIECSGGRLVARPPATIAGKIEVRGLGLVEMEHVQGVPVCLFAAIAPQVERMPDAAEERLLGLPVPQVAVSALEASAPIKLELALQRFGLKV